MSGRWEGHQKVTMEEKLARGRSASRAAMERRHQWEEGRAMGAIEATGEATDHQIAIALGLDPLSTFSARRIVHRICARLTKRGLISGEKLKTAFYRWRVK